MRSWALFIVLLRSRRQPIRTTAGSIDNAAPATGDDCHKSVQASEFVTGRSSSTCNG